MADSFSAEHAQTLLDGVDAAFEAVLHGRYGGGLSVMLLPGGEEQVLRAARAGSGSFLRFGLQARGSSGGTVDGVPIGTAVITASPSAQVASTNVQTEIFLDQDANEACDATALSSGILIESAPAQLPNGGLLVVRSSEAVRNGARLALADQQNWRPNQSRHVAGSGLGASGRGHRQSGGVSLLLPVSAALLDRIGGAVARVPGDFGQVSVVLLAGGGG